MNNQNPFIPQGILIDQKNRSRARLRLAVFSILGVPVLGLLVLLITQGCRREQPQQPADMQQAAIETNLPPVDTNLPPANLPTNLPAVVVPTPTPTPAPTGGATEYTVAKGDTFSSIGKKFNVSTKAIQNANPNVDPLKLQVNQKLVIPAPAVGAPPVSAAGSPEAVPATAGGEQIYTVKSGDTLTSIARSHGITVKAIETANNLTSTRIKVGEKLKIPAKATTSTPAETAPTTASPVPILSNVPAPVR